MKINNIVGVVLLSISALISNTSLAGEKEFLCSNPAAKISINSNQLTVRTACSREQLTQGLMNITTLAENSGMLFIFKNEQNLTFWAKNTYIPIDIAYLNDSLEIVDIHTLKPLDKTIVTSRKPASYALEVNAGWFKNKGIQVGDKVIPQN